MYIMFGSSDVIVMRTEAEAVVGIVEGAVVEVGIGEIGIVTEKEIGKMLTPPLRSIMINLTALSEEQRLYQNKLLTLSPTSRASLAPRPSSRLLHLKNRLSPGQTGAEPPLPHLRSFLAYQV